MTFQINNRNVLSLLLQYTEPTEGFRIIQTYQASRNGRVAWISLLRHFEGATYYERINHEHDLRGIAL